MCVTGRDGWAEVEMPFGFVVAGVGRGTTQEGWVGADDVVEFQFTRRKARARRRGQGI